MMMLPKQSISVSTTLWALFSLLLLSACGSSDEPGAKREKLIEKRKQLARLEAEIRQLEKELAQLDTSFREELDDRLLVTVLPVQRADFAFFVEARASIEAEKNVIITPQTAAKLLQLYIKDGQLVQKGQLVARQDVEVIQRNIEQLKTQLELARTLFEKQQRLWEQNIGTEVQYLQAKSNKESLERQLAALQAQAELANIRAPFTGIIDQVFAKEGEIVAPGTPIARIVSLNEIKVVADLSEAYLNKVRIGDEIRVDLPALQFSQQARISYIGQVIDPVNRTFRVEARLSNPQGRIKPAMVAIIKIREGERKDAILIPISLVQEDVNGKFVYIVDTVSSTVHRRNVEIGKVYNGQAEVIQGLEGDEILVDEGFRFVSDGKIVKIAKS